MNYLSWIICLQLILAIEVSQIATLNVPLVTFDGDVGTTFDFEAKNDPVMGGISIATFEINEEDSYAIFNGTVKIVPNLDFPGFCSMIADGKFNDASGTIDGGINLRVRSSYPEYLGFRMVFVGGAVSPYYSCIWGGTVPFSKGCFKSLFYVPPGDEFVDVTIPFTNFSDHWDPETGNHISECSDNPNVCPTEFVIDNISLIQIAAEGVIGDFHLEVESISATNSH